MPAPKIQGDAYEYAIPEAKDTADASRKARVEAAFDGLRVGRVLSCMPYDGGWRVVLSATVRASMTSYLVTVTDGAGDLVLSLELPNLDDSPLGHELQRAIGEAIGEAVR